MSFMRQYLVWFPGHLKDPGPSVLYSSHPIQSNHLRLQGHNRWGDSEIFTGRKLLTGSEKENFKVRKTSNLEKNTAITRSGVRLKYFLFIFEILILIEHLLIEHFLMEPCSSIMVVINSRTDCLVLTLLWTLLERNRGRLLVYFV